MQENPLPIQVQAPQRSYKALLSAVPGITVFAPDLERKLQSDPKTYRCPQCGHTLAYDVNQTGIACSFCGYRQDLALEQVHEKEERLSVACFVTPVIFFLTALPLTKAFQWNGEQKRPELKPN